MSESCCSNKSPSIVDSSSLKAKLVQYKPLLIIVALSVVGATAVSYGIEKNWMNAAMAFFLLFLAFLKFVNLKGFAMTFERYDVVAKRYPIYALLYPFIELGLALMLFASLYAVATNIVMLVVMLVGCIGIVKVIKTKANVQCGCVGTVFDLPVGRVTLSENLGMAFMAFMNLMMIS